MNYTKGVKQEKQNIIDRFSPAKILENVLTDEQVHELLLFQFQNADRIKWTATSSNIQPSINIVKMLEKFDWLKDIIAKEIGDFWEGQHSGNYFITTQLHDAHADLLTEKETDEDWAQGFIPYKSAVIPIIITARAKAYTAFFNQRHIGHSITLDREFVTSQDDSMYEISRDYPDFYMGDGSVSTFADIEKHPKYIFPHIHPENNRGLSIENVFEFKPGNIMIFDACQIHASCVTTDRPNFHWLKSGINIQFYKKL